MSVVFRSGRERYFTRDTGVNVKNLDPRDVSLKYNIGRTRQIDGLPDLEEGRLYTRNQLKEMRAFL